MAIFTDIETQIAELRDLLGDDVGADELAQRMSALDADALVSAMQRAAAVTRCVERISIVGAGVAASRSGRDTGHGGLAQSRGHRNPAALVQDIAGIGRAEAQRQVRLGTMVLDGADADGGPSSETPPTETTDDVRATDAQAPLPWHAPLTAALLDERISSTQHDAILRGLGAPPSGCAVAGQGQDSDSATGADPDAVEAWRCAAEQLVTEAALRSVEELRQAARTIRDRLDPEGAARRFHERYERRSFRMWIDQDGVQHGHIAFDDEGGAWMTAIRDAALRPRRGGPRFVDSDERERGEALTADPRTNDQLGYDLLIDVLRAGALADAESVFGTRQAGVRIVQIVDPGTREPLSQHTEDGLVPLPAAAVDQRICDSGTIDVSVDACGNPLDVGREHRLFTPRQRVALAIRDGGCCWNGCDRPASYCEAHHIDEWTADHGRTDIDRGILLCRYHHMQLHHGGWRITRDGVDDFELHPPGKAAPVALPRRAALTYGWAGIDPPPGASARQGET